MIRYALRRILMMIPTLIGSTLLVYLLVFLIPGDPVTRLAGGEKRLSDSTIAAIRPPVWVYVSTMPWRASRPEFLSAFERPC